MPNVAGRPKINEPATIMGAERSRKGLSCRKGSVDYCRRGCTSRVRYENVCQAWPGGLNHSRPLRLCMPIVAGKAKSNGPATIKGIKRIREA